MEKLPLGVDINNLISDLRILSWEAADILIYYSQMLKNPSDKEIREWLEGNICRCTGYQNIVAAVKEAATKM